MATRLFFSSQRQKSQTKESELADAQTSASVPRGFTHDDEHPQVEIPFVAQISGRQLRGQSLSLTKALATGLLPKSTETRPEPVILRFDLEGFSINLFLEAFVQTATSSEDGQVTLNFVNPMGPHLASLRYILNSYIAGDIASVGGVLGYTGPVTVKPKSEGAAPGIFSRVANFGRRVAVLGLTVGLGYLALSLAQERIFFAYEPLPVTLEGDGQIMRATAGGQLSYVDVEAEAGEVVYSILANSGDLLSIRMPCACDIHPTADFTEGATVLPGMALVKLTAGDATLQARTTITPEGATRLLKGDAPELVFADGRVVPVALSMRPPEENQADVIPAEVVLPPDLAAAEGDVARLRFQRALLPKVLTDQWARLTQIYRALSTEI